MFYHENNPNAPFKYPIERDLRIEGVVSPELLANPSRVDDENRPCLVVGKDGTATGLTFGRYAGLESFVCDSNGVESVALGFYNRGKWGDRNFAAFADKGDSGALLWDGDGHAVGQLHSAQFKDSASSCYIAYATPAWWLVDRIKLQFPNAVFFRDTWSA